MKCSRNENTFTSSVQITIACNSEYSDTLTEIVTFHKNTLSILKSLEQNGLVRTRNWCFVLFFNKNEFEKDNNSQLL